MESVFLLSLIHIFYLAGSLIGLLFTFALLYNNLV